ncbi:MAG: hypothetical protein VZR06_05135 [Butyrivibrio sp.]|nr:hypothetical protein [Butyrivibrio sp.]
MVMQKIIKEIMAPDVKQYKKIIKEIMGLEAKKNGFKIAKKTSTGYSKTMLAEYERRIDEIFVQRFSIDYDFVVKKLELKTVGITETRSFDGSEEEFRRTISEFADIMHKEGYKNCDKALKEPRYSMAEHGYLLKNYKQLSEKYCKENNIDSDMVFAEKINHINDKVASLRGKEFEEVKEELIMVAAFFTTTLLQCDGTNIKVYGDLDYFAIVQSSFSSVNTLNIILSAWYKKYKYNVIKSSCMALLSTEQFEAIDWKI